MVNYDQLYLIEQVDNGNFEVPHIIKKLTADEASELNKASRHLYEYHYFKRRKSEIILNLDEFINEISKWDSLSKDIQTGDPNIDAAFVNLNRLFINFVSSLNILHDQIDIELKHLYGKKSDQYKVKRGEILSYIYDTYFEYKFCIALRNFVQHNKSYPINKVSIDSEHVIETGHSKKVFCADFDKQLLLSDDNIRKKLCYQLKLYNDYFPVIPIARKMQELIRFLFKKFFSHHLPLYKESANFVTKYHNLRKNAGRIEFGRFSEENGNQVWEGKILPVFIIDDLISTSKEYGL